MTELELKYGCNPNQKPSRIFMRAGSDLPITVLNGRPGYINFMDPFYSWQLGRELKEATGLPVNLFLSHEHGGIEQIGQRIIYNEIDMVLFFNYPQDTDMDDSVMYITRLCDQHSVPMATNVATAEMLIHGLARGDLDWRDIVNPKKK